MKKQYQDLLDKGLLREEKVDFLCVRKVLGKSAGNLRSAEILLQNKQYENAYELAYEAMLSAGRALSFSLGVRPRAQGSHKIVAELASRIFGKDLIVKKLDKMRKNRHYLVYGSGLNISKQEAKEAIKSAKNFFGKVEEFIKEVNPQKELF